MKTQFHNPRQVEAVKNVNSFLHSLFCCVIVDVDRSSVAHQLCKKNGEQSSWLNAMVGDCLCLWKAVAINEINANRLKARKKTVSHPGSIRHLMTARVMWRTVAINEINANRLKAGKRAVSHYDSILRLMTARVMWRAVTISEATYNRLKAGKRAVSHYGSILHLMTARVIWRAVTISEATF